MRCYNKAKDYSSSYEHTEKKAEAKERHHRSRPVLECSQDVQGKAGKRVFAPCRKMGVGGYKEYLLISQRTSLFFKAAPSEKGKMRLGLAMADIYQILPQLCLPQQWMSGRGSLH